MRLTLFVVLTTFALLAAGTGLRAQASRPPTPKAPAQIQLAALMAPVRWPDGRLGTKAVTPVLNLGKGTTVASICDMTPVIRDAVITTLYETPIPGSDHGTLEVGGVKARLTRAVNTALVRHRVKGVELVPGIRPAAVSAQFHNSIKCRVKNKARKSG